MLCQVVFFRNLRGFFVRDVRAKGFAVSERGKDALDGEDLFFFCHFFCFVLHVITISEKIKNTRKIVKYFGKIFTKDVDNARAACYSGGRCKSLTIKHLRGAPA